MWSRKPSRSCARILAGTPADPCSQFAAVYPEVSPDKLAGTDGVQPIACEPAGCARLLLRSEVEVPAVANLGHGRAQSERGSRCADSWTSSGSGSGRRHEQADFASDPEAERQRDQLLGGRSDPRPDPGMPSRAGHRSNTGWCAANAICFKGAWKNPFDPKQTVSASIHRPTGRSRACHQCSWRAASACTASSARTRWEPEFRVAEEVPYKGQELSMAVLLGRHDGLLALESKVTCRTRRLAGEGERVTRGASSSSSNRD